MTETRRLLWGSWTLLLVAGAGSLGHRLTAGDARVFLPGATSHGHHQIELACETCHTTRFPSRDDFQAACVECHGAALAAADDSHPKSKFTDPRNADRVAALDARYCTTCHREHAPEQTLAMGLTVPQDFCQRCHAAIGEERPSHAGLAFTSCADGGCHNFHDNRALYEDFLVARADEPWLRDAPRVPVRTPELRFAEHARATLPAPAADAPSDLPDRTRWVHEWAASGHAAAGVNCSGCHGAGAAWTAQPGVEGCRTCHGDEVEGFLAGRHGMRLQAGLPPMQPALARLPMRADAHGELGCASCHGAHDFVPERAGFEACASCHDDVHTRAFEGSPHFALMVAEREGRAAPGSGVSCATCHMPRSAADGVTRVQHQQDADLRPNEKMVRSVCLDCHGLGFALDALADPGQIARNFRGRPERHVRSIEMATARLREAEPSPSPP